MRSHTLSLPGLALVLEKLEEVTLGMTSNEFLLDDRTQV